MALTDWDRTCLDRAARSHARGTILGHSVNLSSQDGSWKKFRKLEKRGLVEAPFGRWILTDAGRALLEVTEQERLNAHHDV